MEGRTPKLLRTIKDDTRPGRPPPVHLVLIAEMTRFHVARELRGDSREPDTWRGGPPVFLRSHGSLTVAQ